MISVTWFRILMKKHGIIRNYVKWNGGNECAKKQLTSAASLGSNCLLLFFRILRKSSDFRFTSSCLRSLLNSQFWFLIRSLMMLLTSSIEPVFIRFGATTLLFSSLELHKRHQTKEIFIQWIGIIIYLESNLSLYVNSFANQCNPFIVHKYFRLSKLSHQLTYNGFLIPKAIFKR